MQNREGKKGQLGEQKTCIYVSEICPEEILLFFSLVTESKIAPFQVSAILKFDFRKRKQIHFLEENYLNYKKKKIACDNDIFLKTKGSNDR